jgi:hypothetical protein
MISSLKILAISLAAIIVILAIYFLNKFSFNFVKYIFAFQSNHKIFFDGCVLVLLLLPFAFVAIFYFIKKLTI